MTGALVVYSGTFMRYSLAVSPKNYLLFGCHLINFSAQLTQGYRYLNYFKYVIIMPPWKGEESLTRANIGIAGEARKQSSHRLLRRASRQQRLVHRFSKAIDLFFLFVPYVLPKVCR